MSYLVRRNDIKCKYMFMLSPKKIARKGLTAVRTRGN